MRSVRLICIAICCIAAVSANAQSLLARKVSVDYHDMRLEQVLDTIAQRGKFFFSYNSKIVPADSMVSISVQNKTIRQVLDYMFRGAFEYKETESHIIIRRPDAGQYWYVSGYVTDGVTGEAIRDVSVFESNQLVASLTNEQGYFKLRLKDRFPAVSLNISKSWYSDTAVTIKPGIDQQVNVSIKPKAIELDSVIIGSSNRVEGTWWGNLFLSSKQTVQSINLSKFFVDMSFQASVLPGVGTNGRMNGQVSSSFSLNVIGGYSAGVDAVEMGTLFNIVKNDVKYVQASGLVNVVGGRVTGVQLAGLHNNVLDTVVGVQGAGISNVVKGSIEGVQAAGIYNLGIGRIKGIQASGIINTAIDTVSGIQAAGIINTSIRELKGIQYSGILNSSIGEVKGAQYAGILNNSIGAVKGMQTAGVLNVGVKDITGAQLAGVMNVSIGDVKGVQAAPILNYAHKVKGVQIGLVNYADSSDVSIGLFSVVLKGYHKLSFYSDEVLPYNIAVKTGTHWLYNIYMVGGSNSQNNKAYSAGLGYGSELPLSKRFSINPEATVQMLYLGDDQSFNALCRLRLNLNAHFGKFIAVFAGPSYSLYDHNQQTVVEGYKTQIPPPGYKTSMNKEMTSWLGWNVGITFF